MNEHATKKNCSSDHCNVYVNDMLEYTGQKEKYNFIKRTLYINNNNNSKKKEEEENLQILYSLSKEMNNDKQILMGSTPKKKRERDRAKRKQQQPKR